MRPGIYTSLLAIYVPRFFVDPGAFSADSTLTMYRPLLLTRHCWWRTCGDLQKAQVEYEAVVEQAPGNGVAAFNLGNLYLQRSRTGSRTGRWRQLALEQLQRAVRLQPGNEAARRALAAARGEG